MHKHLRVVPDSQVLRRKCENGGGGRKPPRHVRPPNSDEPDAGSDEG
jgi:hypothetical protein